METATGRIMGLSEKGFGFISSPDIKFTRIFFHWTALKPNTLNFTQLKLGMHVRFEPKNIPDKGIRAIKIEVIQNESEGQVNSVIDEREYQEGANLINEIEQEGNRGLNGENSEYNR